MEMILGVPTQSRVHRSLTAHLLAVRPFGVAHLHEDDGESLGRRQVTQGEHHVAVVGRPLATQAHIILLQLCYLY